MNAERIKSISHSAAPSSSMKEYDPNDPKSDLEGYGSSTPENVDIVYMTDIASNTPMTPPQPLQQPQSTHHAHTETQEFEDMYNDKYIEKHTPGNDDDDDVKDEDNNDNDNGDKLYGAGSTAR
eukprot:135859_1